MWYLFNGDLVRANQPVIPLNSRGLMYGDGCFDTISVDHGAVFRLEQHLARLQKAMEYLSLPNLEITNLSDAETRIYSLLEKNNLLDKRSWVRIQVWRTGGRGYHPGETKTVNWAMQCGRYNLADMQQPVTLATVPIRRIPKEALNPLVKLSNGINYIKAAQQAKVRGGDDALMLTIEKEISETTKANLFWLKGDSFYTPSIQCDLLPGITRQFVMECIEYKSPYSLDTGMFKLNELYEADYVFVCNSIRQLVPVHAIDDVSYNEQSNPFRLLKQVFEKHLTSELIKL